MLAVVKKPHIEMALNGESPAELLAWIRRKFEVVVLSPRKGDNLPIEDTDFWREMNRNRAGNLLAGARVKTEMTQRMLVACISANSSLKALSMRYIKPETSASERDQFSVEKV